MRYAEVSEKDMKVLDLTSLTVEEFEQLVPAFEENYQERMKELRLDGSHVSDGNTKPTAIVHYLHQKIACFLSWST